MSVLVSIEIPSATRPYGLDLEITNIGKVKDPDPKAESNDYDFYSIRSGSANPISFGVIAHNPEDGVLELVSAAVEHIIELTEESTG